MTNHYRALCFAWRNRVAFTRKDVEMYLDMKRNTASQALVELRKWGYLEVVGQDGLSHRSRITEKGVRMVRRYGALDPIFNPVIDTTVRVYADDEEEGYEPEARAIMGNGTVTLWAGNDFLVLTENEARYTKAALEALPLGWEEQL